MLELSTWVIVLTIVVLLIILSNRLVGRVSLGTKPGGFLPAEPCGHMVPIADFAGEKA
jgi:hypothetical protein